MTKWTDLWVRGERAGAVKTVVYCHDIFLADATVIVFTVWDSVKGVVSRDCSICITLLHLKLGVSVQMGA